MESGVYLNWRGFACVWGSPVASPEEGSGRRFPKILDDGLQEIVRSGFPAYVSVNIMQFKKVEGVCGSVIYGGGSIAVVLIRTHCREKVLL